MALPTIKERLAALDLAAPRFDPTGIEQALAEHLALLNAPASSFLLVGDAEAAFVEVAKMVRRGWVAAAGPGPRWTHWAAFGYSTSFGLWDGRGYFKTGGGGVSRLDREVVRAARRSTFHWRKRRESPAGAVPNPVIAAAVAERASWDESDAAQAEPAPPLPGTWDSSATKSQKAAYWRRSDAWHKWSRSPNRQARERLEPAQPLVEAVEAGLFAFFWLHSTQTRHGRRYACVAVPRPRMVVEPTGRGNSVELHAWDQPAVQWPGGPSYWYWHDIRIWRELVDQQSRLTARYVARTRNAERRRVLLDRLGYERFLETASAELMQQDDYGKLWHTEIRLDGEAVNVVEVLNSTPEPDGSSRRYFLRVPPHIRTARAAVAWTFGFDNARQYQLASES